MNATQLKTLTLCGLSLLSSSCAMIDDPQYQSDATRLKHGNYVNGKDKFQPSNYCFLTSRDNGVVVSSFDSKPFFVEWTQGSKVQKVASPIRLAGNTGWSDFVVSPGPHSLTVKFEALQSSGIVGAVLGINEVRETIDTEASLEFTAESGHTYLIKANLGTDPKTKSRTWHPEIQDFPPKQELPK